MLKQKLNIINIVISILTLITLTNIAYSRTLDVSIYYIEFPNKILSNEQTPMSIFVNNNSDDILNSFDISVFIDGNEEVTLNWTGSIDAWSSENVEVGSFQFTEKTPLAPYEVYATISNPNNLEVGSEYSNTMTEVQYVNPALSGGTYSLGASGDDFEDINSLNAYVNVGGYPTGDVTFNIRPGTYTDAIYFEYYYDYYEEEETNKNQFSITFQKLPNSSGKVLFDWYSSGEYSEYSQESENENQSQIEGPMSNYAMYFSNYNNIFIKDIEFDIDYGFNPYEAGGIAIYESENIRIENCIFKFVTEEPESTSVFTNAIYASGVNEVEILNNNFEDGQYGINLQSYDICNREVMIAGNTFKNQTDYSIYTANWIFDCPNYVNNTIIEENIFLNDMPETNSMAIYSHNGTTISGNSLSGFKGNGNDPGPSLITVEHNDTDLDDEVIIEDNEIDNVTDMTGVNVTNVGSGRIRGNNIKISTGTYNNISKSAINYSGAGNDSKYLWAEKNTVEVDNGNGIELHNTNAKIYYNSIDVNSENPANEFSGLIADNSSGYIANNRVRGEDVNGFLSSNSGTNKNTSTGLFFCYNSVAVNSPNNAPLKVNSGANAGTSVLRNMFLNDGGGEVIVGTSMGGPIWSSNQNNLKTSGSNIGSWNGSSYSNISDFRNASNGDENSASVDVEFLEDGSLRPKEFTPELVFEDPLFNPEGPLAEIFAECEQFDFFGNERQQFFVGFNNPLIEVTIVQEPDDVVDCYGTQGRFLYTLATATSGLAPKYQWFKDGEPLEGQTFPGLNFGPLEHEMAGVFKCAVTATGAADTSWTREVTVYVLRTPSITVEPKSVSADLGSVATLKVESNIYGEQPPSYKVDVQWYKGNTPLDNDDRYEGVHSSYLTIKNVQQSDYADDYWVRLIGNCGALNSSTVSINEPPSVDFNTQPTDITICENEEFKFTVDAVATNSGTIVSYQWYANGEELEEGEFTGVNSATLSGTATEPLTNVFVEITVNPGEYKFTSDEVSLTLNTTPIITSQPTDIEIEEGSNGELSIEISNTNIITYEWYKNGDNTILSTESTLTFTNAQTTDEGLYYCKVLNDCGEVTSSSASVTVKTSGAQLSVEGLRNEFKLYNAPNPTENETTIYYTINKLADVRLVISDMAGNELIEMNRGLTAPSTYSMKLDANKLNLSSGVYYYTLYVDGKSVTNKLIIEK